MSELGRQLKEARLQKGMSLDDVQEVTKIRKKYLEAIEAGDYKALPGSFYVRAFIKTYAEAVGVNPDELMQEQGMVQPPAAEPSTMETVMSQRSRRSESQRSVKWLPTVLMWVFPVLILAVIYIYASNWGHSDSEKTDPVNLTESSKLPSAVPSAGQAASPAPTHAGAGADPSAAPSVEPSPSPSPSPSPEADGTVVQDRKSGKTTVFRVTGSAPQVVIDATGESWLEVYRGTNSKGEKLNFATTASGDHFTYTLDSAGLYIKSGNSPYTTITVNGQTVTDGKTTSRILLELDSGGTGTSADGGAAGDAAGTEAGTEQSGD
ncbi:helix-turn-helix domain-containing protein [Paenibacillus glufosinatiresistens]|uniref:helix-turn-helix domain-containing protein n=1 Tax=Paenibacillus glufosinatiresistens TaxID=3070657 RepID=UPI00286D7941|nr:RodZ domain-containing protein [Paenibacillus sp. YX.27]